MTRDRAARHHIGCPLLMSRAVNSGLSVKAADCSGTGTAGAVAVGPPPPPPPPPVDAIDSLYATVHHS
jgi:hypothetical protein